MTDSALYTLYISNDAFDELFLQARMLGYVHGTERAKGISAYITFLMTCDIQDARPEEVRAQDAELLANHITPEWRLYAPRVRHNVKLAMPTLIEGAAHALRLGISYPATARIQGAPVMTDLVQCMSALLEAIGTEWLDVKVKQDAQT
jgi:hypothetical protein